MRLSVIVAVAEGGVIGKDNGLPWRLPEDLKRFKAVTLGHPVIMGRKTFESIGRPLPGRLNLVVTRNRSFRRPGVETVGSLEEALQRVDGDEEAFVIGGAALFAEAFARADRLYLTLIHHGFPGDTRFPTEQWLSAFHTVKRTEHTSTGEPHFQYSFIEAERG